MSGESKALRRLMRKLTTETLWVHVIRVLLERPRYAYEIKVALRDRGVRAATVTVYAVLYKMVREGLIEAFEANGTKYYRVTEKGIKEYARALSFMEDMLAWLKEGLRCLDSCERLGFPVREP